VSHKIHFTTYLEKFCDYSRVTGSRLYPQLQKGRYRLKYGALNSTSCVSGLHNVTTLYSSRS
jgi:hypothetical protein